jgi:hypothetical protein
LHNSSITLFPNSTLPSFSPSLTYIFSIPSLPNPLIFITIFLIVFLLFYILSLTLIPYHPFLDPPLYFIPHSYHSHKTTTIIINPLTLSLLSLLSISFTPYINFIILLSYYSLPTPPPSRPLPPPPHHNLFHYLNPSPSS